MLGRMYDTSFVTAVSILHVVSTAGCCSAALRQYVSFYQEQSEARTVHTTGSTAPVPGTVYEYSGISGATFYLFILIITFTFQPNS